MGVCIYMAISHSVTREEWADVYQETLRLVEALPLAEVNEVPVRGIPTMCMVRTAEREERYGWRDEKTRVCWTACGDYDTLSRAEEYSLQRDLVKDELFDEEAPDAMCVEFPSHLAGFSWDDKRFDRCYRLWGAKTQGEPYHMYLLAIACLIEARLGKKAYVYGDITKGQCESAVRMANKCLARPIAVPDTCDEDRLLSRVRGLPLDETQALHLFTQLYLGRQDGAFGTFVRDHFRAQTCYAYWEERFDGYGINTIGFNEALKEYLLWGFDLERLCSLVSLTDDEGHDLHESFVTCIMDAKLHLREKDCSDVLDIDADLGVPYGTGIQFAQFFLGGARNKKVDRYIPLEEIRATLRRAFGGQCPTDEIIDAYLEKEAADMARLSESGSVVDVEGAIKADPSRFLNDSMRARMQAEERRRQKYDIAGFKYLPYFETGDTVHPSLMESVRKYFVFYRGVTDEDEYRKLMEETPERRCWWLRDSNAYVLLRDTDWERIYDDVMAHPESFARYYPMARVVTDDKSQSAVRAFVTNDALWGHLAELAKDEGK